MIEKCITVFAYIFIHAVCKCILCACMHLMVRLSNQSSGALWRGLELSKVLNRHIGLYTEKLETKISDNERFRPDIPLMG